MPATTIAFHGDYASGAMLRRDAGAPNWIDRYFDGHSLFDAIEFCRQFQSVVLVGYSRGGDLVARLSPFLANIVAAVIYESPASVQPKSDFPALLIWNKRGRQDTDAGKQSDQRWRVGRHIDTLRGKGRHVRFVFGWPPIGHAWDRSLNPAIGRWVRSFSS